MNVLALLIALPCAYLCFRLLVLIFRAIDFKAVWAVLHRRERDLNEMTDKQLDRYIAKNDPFYNRKP